MSDPPRALVPGDRLDRYELVDRSAAGDVPVFRARAHGEPRLERPIAIRVATSPALARRLLDEARIASAIPHPNVLEVIDVGQDGATLFVVTEWLDGVDLAALQRAAVARGERVPVGVALRIVADVASALDALHGARDDAGEPIAGGHGHLNLASVTVTRRGIAKLTDFGGADPSRVAAAPPFLPPEAADGAPADERADVWALGAILRVLVAGEPAVGGAQPPPFPADVPRIVRAIITRALAPRADERFATAVELGVAIERAIIDARIDAGARVVAAWAAPHLAPAAADADTKEAADPGGDDAESDAAAPSTSAGAKGADSQAIDGDAPRAVTPAIAPSRAPSGDAKPGAPSRRGRSWLPQIAPLAGMVLAAGAATAWLATSRSIPTSASSRRDDPASRDATSEAGATGRRGGAGRSDAAMDIAPLHEDAGR